MPGNEPSADLFKLYLVVREKGGYEAVSENGLWDSVAKESGLDSSFSSSVKLTYLTYLNTLAKWLRRPVPGKDSIGGIEDSGTKQSVILVGSESELKRPSYEISDQKNNGNQIHLDLEENKLDFSYGRKLCKGGEVWSYKEVDESQGNDKDKGEGNDNISVDDEKYHMGFESLVKEDGCNRKRKCERSLVLLDWVSKVATDPCDPAIGSLPESSKWKSCGSDELWKQVLLVRKAMLLKRNADSSAVQSIWQKKRKMHPTMYENHSVSDRSRCNQRIPSEQKTRAILSFKKSKGQACPYSSSSSGTQSDFEDRFDKRYNPRSADLLNGLWVNNYSRTRIPVGPSFQAKVPEWTGETCESDSKWLGTRSWPLGKRENRNILIERDRVGFGGHDVCGCEFPGSFKCVRFHISKKRILVKRELGSAFYLWHIDKMGEEVALSWASSEEKEFKAIVKSNPLSENKYFWDEIYKLFPYKRREQLVSYYFNVFLLRRRSYQNRSTHCEINSDDDDDESEIGSTTNCIVQGALKSTGSIYFPPKKANFGEH